MYYNGMSGDKESDVFLMLQPDLLTEEELIQRIQSRCCRIENLRLMAKEGLVRLFRRVILPLPQRFYRANRRGKMLASRRAEADVGGRWKEEGCSQERLQSRISAPGDRLKPPPDPSKSHKIQIGSRKSVSGGDVNEAQSTGGRRGERGEGEGPPSDRPSGRKLALKRSSNYEKPTTPTPLPTENKKRRTAIRWP